MLAELARRSEALLRDVDVLARYGGGQFTLLLPSTPLDGAHLLAERLRMQIVSKPYQVGDEQLLVSVSIGVVALRDGDQRAPHLIARADRALFHAKDQGRNRVAVSGWALRLAPLEFGSVRTVKSSFKKLNCPSFAEIISLTRRIPANDNNNAWAISGLLRI